MVPKTYERNLRSPKFYSTAVTGRKGYNPELVCIEEVTRDTEGTLHKWAQTISGSNYSDQWPNYDHYIVYGAWEETTYSG